MPWLEFESDNILQAVKNYIYINIIRPRTPPKPILVNGEYTVYGSRIFDDPQNDRLDGHELELLRGISRSVEPDDNVILVGGGIGVSAVECAERVGDSGNVRVFEASNELVGPLRRTMWLNQIEEVVETVHSAVGPIHSLWGKRGEKTTKNPSNLPSCDVLILDCEGAEADILSNLEIQPRSVVVEHHGFLGSSKEKIKEMLQELEYTIELHEFETKEKDVGIFTAHLEKDH